MKLSSKGRYGVRAMLELALHYNQGSIPLKVVAQNQDISDTYLEQLISVLRKSGLVKSVRGAQGGYMLARDPAEITVGDVVRALEGPIAPVECVGEVDSPCLRADKCVSRNLWARLRDKMNEVLDATTLADMCQEVEALNNSDNYMYFI